jgi:c-di-GMP-binding flagellar brake protein YcgR
MSAKELELNFGDVLQLQFLPDESQIRHYVRVIGYMPNHSILVSTPVVNGKVMLVRESQRAAVRTMAKGNIIAFTGSVLRSCARPYPYLHLSYPTDLQILALRKSQRISFCGAAEVRENPVSGHTQAPLQTYHVQIVDMSTSGALLISEQRFGHIKSVLSISMNVHVAGGEECFATVAIIRNIRERKNQQENMEYLYGVEFKTTNRKDIILLHAFINEQIVNG